MAFEKKVLVIDDDDAIRTLIVTVFGRRGLSVDSARNGVEALEKLSSTRYALLVLDLMMPLMNGYQVLERLGQLSPTARPFVLVLTAGTEPRKFDPSLVVGTLPKPFDIELLVDTVYGCLSAADSLSPVDPAELMPDSPARSEEAN